MVELQNTGQLDLVLASHKLSQCRAQLINLYGKNPVILLQTLSMLLQTVSFIVIVKFLSSFLCFRCWFGGNYWYGHCWPLRPYLTSHDYLFTYIIINLHIFQEHKLLTEEFQQQCMSPMSGPMTPLSGPMTPLSAPMTPHSAPMTPHSAPMTPDMNPVRSGGLPAISNTLTNLDSWGQSANIICQYLGNTKWVAGVPCGLLG